MILAKGRCPSSVLPRLALVLLGAGLVAGCQSTERIARPAVQAGGWQVVERLGDARYQPPAGGAWAPAMPADRLPDGSKLATGSGGRLIVARAGANVSAGPASRFTLPDGAPGAPLEQHAGWLRYRVAEASPAGLVVVTPFLEMEVGGTVFDATVSATATEVSVEHGRVRIATPDGVRQIELGPGQSAYAGGPQHELLAFRRAPRAPLEPVEAMVLPAMHPRAGVRESRAVAAVWRAADTGTRASTSGAAASAAMVPIAKAEVVPATATAAAAERPASPVPGRPAPQSQPARAERLPLNRQAAAGASPAPGPAIEGAGRMPPRSEAARAAPAGREPGGDASEDPQPTAFDRLSDGMVDGVSRALQFRLPAPDGRAL